MIGRSGDFLFRLTQATTTADLSPLHRPCAAHLDLDTHNHIELHLTFASPFRRGLLLYTAAITQGFFLGHSHQTTFHAPARTRRLREALHRTLISARISSSPWPSLASPILGCIWVRIILTNTCDVRRRDTRVLTAFLLLHICGKGRADDMRQQIEDTWLIISRYREPSTQWYAFFPVDFQWISRMACSGWTHL